MAKVVVVDPRAISGALSQLLQMIMGAECELNAGRPHASGTLSIAGAVRAVDLICDASLVEDFSLCHTHKTGFNYSASDLDLPDAQDVLEAAKRLFVKAVAGVKENGWFPKSLHESDFDLV